MCPCVDLQGSVARWCVLLWRACRSAQRAAREGAEKTNGPPHAPTLAPPEQVVIKLWPLMIEDPFMQKFLTGSGTQDLLVWFAGARGGVETSVDDEEVVEKRRLAGCDGRARNEIVCECHHERSLLTSMPTNSSSVPP